MEHVKDKRIVRRMLRKINLKVWAKTGADIGWEALGSLLLAVTTYNVALSAEFPMTGFSGIAMILYRLFQIPMGLSTILLNIPVAVICGKLIGKRFLVKSFRCMILSSLMLDYLAPLFPVYEGDRMVAALITGTVGAMGYAMIYVRGSSTGGSDFINLAIKAVRPHWNLGTIAFLSDVGIILTGGILFRDMDGIVYGMVINLLFAVVVDKVILGMNAGMVALIVTEHGKEGIIMGKRRWSWWLAATRTFIRYKEGFGRQSRKHLLLLWSPMRYMEKGLRLPGWQETSDISYKMAGRAGIKSKVWEIL